MTRYFSADDSRQTIVYFDGTGKPLQSRQQMPQNNTYAVSKVQYDNRGNSTFFSYPRTESGASYTSLQSEEAGNAFTYDVLDRILTRQDAS